jgi:predicted transcriptional regulator
MIDFACKKFDLEEVIKCGLSLTKADFFILKFLIKNNSEFDSLNVSKKLKIDLSSAQRSLKKLREKGLVKRKQINLSSGGYVYKYSSKPKSEIKGMILDIVKSWSKRVEEELELWA